MGIDSPDNDGVLTMSHVTCEWVMAHMWMSHGIYEWVMAHMWISHGTCKSRWWGQTHKTMTECSQRSKSTLNRRWHTHTHTYTHTHTHTHTHTCTHTHTHAHTCTHTHTHTHIHTRMYTHTHTGAHADTCVHTYTSQLATYFEKNSFWKWLMLKRTHFEDIKVGALLIFWELKYNL